MCRGRRSISISRLRNASDINKGYVLDSANDGLQNTKNARRLTTASLDDLTNLANHMNAQMANRMDALTGALTDRIEQLQDELVKQLRSKLNVADSFSTDVEGQMATNGQSWLLDPMQQIQKDAANIQNHLHYRGCLSQVARRRDTEFDNSQSLTHSLPNVNGQSAYDGSFYTRPMLSPVGNQTSGSTLNFQTMGKRFLGESGGYDSTSRSGNELEQMHEISQAGPSPSQYSPIAW